MASSGGGSSLSPPHPHYLGVNNWGIGQYKSTNQNPRFRSRDWLSANQGSVFPELGNITQLEKRTLIASLLFSSPCPQENSTAKHKEITRNSRILMKTAQIGKHLSIRFGSVRFGLGRFFSFRFVSFRFLILFPSLMCSQGSLLTPQKTLNTGQRSRDKTEGTRVISVVALVGVGAGIKSLSRECFPPSLHSVPPSCAFSTANHFL
eukprot:sb/3470416/